MKRLTSLNNGCILGCPGGCGGDVQVDILHRFLDACCAYLEGLEQPAYFSGSTSSSVMEQRFQWLIGSRCEAKADFPRMLSQWIDTLISFPYLCKQKDWNAGGCLSTSRRWQRYGPLNRILITGQR